MTHAIATENGVSFNYKGPAKGPKNFAWWYDHIIDLMLADPTITRVQIANLVGRSYQWVCTLMNSDMFRARYEQRRDQHSLLLHETIAAKTAEVALVGLDEMKDRIRMKGNQIPFEELAKGTNQMLERLGYGQPAPAEARGVQVNVYPVASQEELKAAQDTLRLVEGRLLSEPPSAPKAPPLVEYSEGET